MNKTLLQRLCEDCGAQTHTDTAKFCPQCGIELPDVLVANEPTTTSPPNDFARDQSKPVYRLSEWSMWLTIVLGICAFALAAVGVTAFQVADLTNKSSSASSRRFDQLVSQMETAFQGLLLAGLASMVLLACWSWRVTKNAEKWGAPTRSPGWAAGSWFCPFINFFVPYANLKEVWEITDKAAPNASDTEPPLIHAFVGLGGTTIISFFAQEDPTSLSQMSGQLNLLGWLLLVQAVSVILIIVSVRTISERQDQLIGA